MDKDINITIDISTLIVLKNIIKDNLIQVNKRGENNILVPGVWFSLMVINKMLNEKGIEVK